MNTTATNSFEIRTTVQISDDRVRDLLCCAFEGGSNYWYAELGLANKDSKKADFNLGGSKRPAGLDDLWSWIYVAPFVEGEGLRFVDGENNVDPADDFFINRETIQKALQTMAEKYPTRFNNFVTENDDAETGDVFLQCLAFGEVQYC